MATLYVRNIPDELYEHLQQLAKAENRSINAQVITLLQNALLVKTQQPQEKTCN
jgi:antitoxin FitA